MDSEVKSSLLFYSAILVLKTMCMSLVTAFYRTKNKIPATPEDLYFLPTGRVVMDDPGVERVRRAHLNDLENIPIFLIAAYLCAALCNPTPYYFNLHMQIFTGMRCIHSVILIAAVRQPLRSFIWTVGWTACLSFVTQLIAASSAEVLQVDE